MKNKCENREREQVKNKACLIDSNENPCDIIGYTLIVHKSDLERATKPYGIVAINVLVSWGE